jgi:uncharacterized protein
MDESESGALLRTRVAAGLSQRDLAARAGTTQAMVARYESGEASPTVATLRRLMAACGQRLALSTSPMGPALAGPIGHRVNRNRKQIRRLARQAGARNVRVFGSVARGDESEGSDLDLLVDFPVRARGLLPLADLADRISELLELPVDVAAEDALAPEVAARALADAVSL